jgi:NAD-dependent dihydropyrimidine dehydrogenase PreA subunit
MYNAYAVNTLALDSVKCNGCGICTVVCPHAVFAMQDRKAILAHAGRCMECGACGLNCPTDAIRVESGTGCATAMMIAAVRGLPMETGTCG